MTAQIELDGSLWKTEKDFYSALLLALGAPDWHGHNLDALEESLRAGDINQINAPIQITIFASPVMGTAAERAARRFVDLCYELAEDGVGIDAAMAV